MNISINHRLIALIAAIGSTITASHAATLTSGYTIGSGSQLLVANGGVGTTLFSDTAALGGANNPSGTGSTSFSVLQPGTWSVGATVNITGVAMALRNTTQTGTFTFDIRQGAGGTGTAGVGGLSSIATRTASYSAGATGTYYVNFDTPVTFVADANSTSIVISWSSTAVIDWKSEATTGGGRLNRVNTSNGNNFGTESVRFSVAGSVIPEPSATLLGIFGCLGLLRRRR